MRGSKIFLNYIQAGLFTSRHCVSLSGTQLEEHGSSGLPGITGDGISLTIGSKVLSVPSSVSQYEGLPSIQFVSFVGSHGAQGS
jgi:hypothetical protein